MDIIRRHLHPRVLEALDTFRVVVIHGPRQCGKTTLARLVAEERGGNYITLDDRSTLRSAQEDPLGLLSEGPFPLVVDEVQRGGDELVRVVKQIVDTRPDRGRFLLTGSSNFLTVPTISESLAGRAGILSLWPLSEAEIEGTPSTVVDGWFDAPAVSPSHTGSAEQFELSGLRDCLQRLCRGGYPDVRDMTAQQRQRWALSYVDTVLQRDLKDVADLRKASMLPSLLRWASAVSGAHVNVTTVASQFEMSWHSARAYLDWLKMVFLLHDSPAWSRNLAKRETRSPKTYATDAGLAAAQLRLTADHLQSPSAAARGPLVETFVFNEILRQASAAVDPPGVYHYRDRRGHEVDVVLEGPGGAVLAIEVKATSSPHPGQLRTVKWLRDHLDEVAPGTFRAGYLLHTGRQSLPIGDRLYLRPISSLWTSPSAEHTA